MPDGTWSPWFGHGKVDAEAAVAEALRLRQGPIVGTTIRQSSAPARAIPDNNAAGITDTINIAAAAAIGTLKITLDITHTFIGDLNASLQTPAGTSVALHQRTGGSADNLIQRYTFTNTPALQTLRGQPIKYLIYSHHHFDHIAGGKPFKDAVATIIAHKNAKARLAVIQDPATVLPDETVDTSRTIKLGDTTLELSYIGLNHSDSSLVMRLPKEKIIFAVDFISVGSVPGRGMIDSYPLEWEDSLKKVLAMEWERIIPGHPGPGGRLGTKQDVQNLLAFLQDASAEIKAAAREGKCWDAVEKELKLPKYADWPGYEQNLPFVLRRYCGLWGRGT